MFERITFESEVMGGRACVRGMRITVSAIVRQVAQGATVEEILVDHPDLEREDVRQALEYAAWLAEEPGESARAARGRVRRLLARSHDTNDPGLAERHDEHQP